MSRLRRTLDSETRRLRNRVLSIAHDAQFVRGVVLFHNHGVCGDAEEEQEQVLNRIQKMPVLANLRCGLWYAMCAGVCDGTAYFKSTDGHANVWNFSLRRLNLHVVEKASATGVFLVDATKRGRIMPDAFARTLPIWCATLNRAVAMYRGYLDKQGRDCREKEQEDGRKGKDSGASSLSHDEDSVVWWDWDVHVPPYVVSKEECQMIYKRVHDHCAALLASRVVNMEWLDRTMGDRPLRVFWITPATRLICNLRTDFTCNGKYAPIVCISASAPVDTEWMVTQDKAQRNGSGFCYLQGAGDDHEMWAHGLTPRLLQENWDAIVGLARSGGSAAAVEQCVSRIVQEARKDSDSSDGFFYCPPTPAISETSSPSTAPCRHQRFNFLGQVSGIAIGSRRAGRPPECWDNFDSVLAVTVPNYYDEEVHASEVVHCLGKDRLDEYLHLPVAEGKRDKLKLIQVLPLALVFVLTQIARGRQILIHCNQGQDRSVGIAVAAVALFCVRDSHEVIPHSWCKGDEVSDDGNVGGGTRISWMGFEQFAGDEMNTDEELARAHSARLLLGPNGKSLFFRWMHHICKSVTMDTECGDRLPSPLALPDKTTLRQALSTVTLYHGLANPSRLTMRKLSRFFTEV